MRKKLSLLLLTLVLAVVAAACGTQDSANKEEATGNAAETAVAEKKELKIQHQLGETVVPKNPQKVVVFDFGTLDSLDKLGVEVTGVPQADVPSYLSKYEDTKYENVGGLKEPDFEKISEIAPDLIIISGRQEDAYEELSKIAPTIFLGVDTANYMESYKKNVTVLGNIFGKEDAVKEELAKVEQSAQKLKEQVKASGENALIILVNEGNISAYGPGSRFGMIHDVLGFTPVDPNIEVSTHGQNVSFEYVAEKNPDYLFVIDRGAVMGEGESSAKKLVENELVKNTKAYQNGNIVYLDPNFWYLSGGGLVSVAEMMKEVEEGLK